MEYTKTLCGLGYNIINARTNAVICFVGPDPNRIFICDMARNENIEKRADMIVKALNLFTYLTVTIKENVSQELP